jgi:formylglycine-generating enzyme required for sulfatase activity
MEVIESTKTNLLEEIRKARVASDQLFKVLKPEAIYDRPIAERHRVIFYVGHLDGFDSIQICREGLGLKSKDEELDALFQAGIDPDSSHLPSDTPADWPSALQVADYVRRCRERVDAYLEQAPDEVVQMALEHREMHLETLAYMFHNFGYDRKIEPLPADHRRGGSASVDNDWCEIPTGEAVLGKANDGSFGWDNEYDEFRTRVPQFRIQRHSVTNGEYRKFVTDGAPAPPFWVQRGASTYYRGMFREFPLPLDWPVYVTQLEAQAYADWLGKALPSEAQFHRAAYGTASGQNREFPWGSAEPTHAHGNFDGKRWDPEPVTASLVGSSAFGVAQMVGNGWQWTNSVFAPFEGFAARPSYPGYSANFFDNEHYVMKGASPRTPKRLLRRSFRNWFRRDYPYMYATFRCVEN